MRIYTDFSEAFADWRMMGGILNHEATTGPQTWAVREWVDDDQDAREMTIEALRRGGLTKEQIDEEMKDFV